MNEETKEPQKVGDLIDSPGFFERMIAEAPETIPETPKPPNRTLNDSFFPDYREPWDVEDPGEDFRSKLARSIAIAEAGGIGLLVGSHGTGKTRLLAETARALLGRKRSRYLKTSKLIRLIRATYNRNSTKTEDDLVEELTRVPVLMVDEIDKRSETPNENALLFSVIDDRFDLKRPTLIAGNIAANDLSNRIDPALLDRAKVGGGLILFEGESFRRRP